jgi:hypothetical protein
MYSSNFLVNFNSWGCRLKLPTRLVLDNRMTARPKEALSGASWRCQWTGLHLFHQRVQVAILIHRSLLRNLYAISHRSGGNFPTRGSVETYQGSLEKTRGMKCNPQLGLEVLRTRLKNQLAHSTYPRLPSKLLQLLQLPLMSCQHRLIFPETFDRGFLRAPDRFRSC